MPQNRVSTEFIFEAFAKLNVMVIGDVMLDRYIYGKANRISPEAPVPILEYQSEAAKLGGAANVALNLSALGAKTILCGVIGNDSEGSSIEKTLLEKDIPTIGLFTSPHRCTTLKTRFIAGTHQIMRMDREVTQDLSEVESESFLSHVLALIEAEPPECIIFQDYNKGVLTPRVIEVLTEAAKNKGAIVAVDPKFKNFWHYKDVDVFKPNLREVQEALNLSILPTESSLSHAAQLIRSKLSCGLVLITLSEKGLYVNDGHQSKIHETMPRNVADVCGAGDTVISVAALGRTMNLPLEQLALLSNLAGGQVVEKIGVAVIDRQQLSDEIKQMQP